jgi:hypothetical protein
VGKIKKLLGGSLARQVNEPKKYFLQCPNIRAIIPLLARGLVSQIAIAIRQTLSRLTSFASQRGKRNMNGVDLFEEEIIVIEEEIPKPKATNLQKNAKKKWKPEEEKYSEGFFIRCTKAEKDAIEIEAASFEMSQARFLIAKALNARGVLSREETKIASTAIVELSRISNNINQIAKGINSTRLRGEIAEITQKQLFAAAETAKQIAYSTQEMMKNLYGNRNNHN